MNQENQQKQERQNVSPTLRALDKSLETACAVCPNSLWYGTAKKVECFCRLMHAVTWNADSKQSITHCDGLFVEEDC